MIGAVLLAISLAVSAPASASLVLDQPAITGQPVSFTAVYGKVYHGRQPQLPNQPQVQVNCSNGWQGNVWTINKVNLGQGWTQSVYPFEAFGGSGTCSAVLFYFDGSIQLHELAFAYFDVTP